MRAKKPYHKRRPPRQQIELLCGAVGPGDGLDPREDKPEVSGARHSRKTLQLCRQVERALVGILAADSGDPWLSQLSVQAVRPGPHSGRMVATLQVPQGLDPDTVLAHLGRAAGRIRCELAAAIHRRRVPEIAYCLVETSPSP